MATRFLSCRYCISSQYCSEMSSSLATLQAPEVNSHNLILSSNSTATPTRRSFIWIGCRIRNFTRTGGSIRYVTLLRNNRDCKDQRLLQRRGSCHSSLKRGEIKMSEGGGRDSQEIFDLTCLCDAISLATSFSNKKKIPLYMILAKPPHYCCSSFPPPSLVTLS